MKSVALGFDHISKSYSNIPVIRDLSLAIKDKVTTAIVGESGSGKSTLLQLANGLIQPEKGTVTVLHEILDYKNLPLTRRRMGYAVQGAGLFPHMTVFENVVLLAQREKWPQEKIKQRFSYLVGLLDLDATLEDRYPHSLSGGQQQRVSLCRAMMLNPPILLLDEPFSALDPLTRESIHGEFLKLQEAESRAIVLVTHDMEEALKLAEELVILREGEVLQSGPVAQIRDSPNCEYVERLFSSLVST
ncbi:MAG: osmoprotectant transport system ATP-binding protein [Candidatus Azotimanducaceae bacterium]